MLGVDEVVELTDTRIRARKRVDPGLDVFRGHYPNHPILPGVLLCEAALQAGAILISQLPGGAVPAGQVPVGTRINNVKCRRVNGFDHRPANRKTVFHSLSVTG